jgi:lipopolysaccharide biosynthesis protein
MEKIKRMAFFALFNERGRLTNDVEFLITSLKKSVNKLVIIVNGFLQDYQRVNELADYVIVRENVGFDAGAYKEALFDDTVRCMLQECNELVFCNDTFYGPFIPFQDIFKRMAGSKSDFWGLNLSNSGLVTFIQSYFLVFRRRILEGGDLRKFFDDNIDGKTRDFQKVLISFEQNIFSFLVDKGYGYDALNEQKYHIFTAVDGSVCYDKLPILKKKAFTSQYYDKDRILNSLHYIDENYNYDIGLIIENARDNYHVELDYDEIKKHSIEINSKQVAVSKVKKEDIDRFVKKHKKLYIYGTGACGKKVTEIVGTKFILGYIVSDDKRNADYLYNIPIYNISEFYKKTETPIIVALGKINREQVHGYLEKFINVIYWE